MDTDNGDQPLVSDVASNDDDDEPCINFEGPEKVLEVWFVPPAEYEDPVDDDEKKSVELSSSSSAVVPLTGGPTSAANSPCNSGVRRHLRLIKQEEWEPMLDLVHCKVIRYIYMRTCVSVQ